MVYFSYTLLAAAKTIDAKKVTAKYLLAHARQKSERKKANNIDESLRVRNKQYIPESVADDYLTRLKAEKPKTRINVYKEIINAWLNSRVLFEVINQDVLQCGLNSSYKQAKDIGWAMKALASSGEEKYVATLENVSANTTDKKIKKSADKAMEYFLKRKAPSRIVHDVNSMNSKLSWQENQLSNMIHSENIDLRMYAAKAIYREHLNNVYLTDLLAEKLEKESMSKRYTMRCRFFDDADFHAWAVRVLAFSKNAKYKPLLENCAQKVREYAEKFLREFK